MTMFFVVCHQGVYFLKTNLVSKPVVPKLVGCNPPEEPEKGSGKEPDIGSNTNQADCAAVGEGIFFLSLPGLSWLSGGSKDPLKPSTSLQTSF